MNQETARVQSRLNNPNSYGPGGAVEHVWGPDDTQSVYTYLSPEQQRIYDNETQVTGDASQVAVDATGRLSDLLKTPVTTDGLPVAGGSGLDLTKYVQSSIPGANDPMERMSGQDYGQQRDQVTQAILSRVEPQYQRDRTDLDAKLAAQGFTPGSQGYQSAADEINRNRTDARMQAVLAGGQEQSRLAGLDQNRVQTDNQASEQEFQNNATNLGFWNQAQAQAQNMSSSAATNANNFRSQQLAERLQLRAQPINEVAALFGLGNGVQVPQQAQVSPVQVGSPDYQGLVSNNYKSQSAAAAQGNATTAGAVTAIASAAAIAI